MYRVGMPKQPTAPPVQDKERGELLDRIATLTDVANRLRTEVQLLKIVYRHAMVLLSKENTVATRAGLSDAIEAYKSSRPAAGTAPDVAVTDVSTKPDKYSF